MNGSELSITSSKITLQHLERMAYVYVRQSTPKQIERHQESQRYQSQLSRRAQTLGWSADRTRVIDADLGLSGQGSSYRDDFQELVAEVSLGHVGHLLRMRLEAGRLSAVQRGVFRVTLSTGLVRLPDSTVVKDPDQQVQHVLELVFNKFAEPGSCRQLLRYLNREKILRPRRHSAGQRAGELLWKPPTDGTLSDILHNPAYAGAFVFGRRQLDPARRQPNRRGVGVRHRPIDEWLHLQQNAYPAYISWEQYLANQEKLRENSTHFTRLKENRRGPAREGAALLQGLAVCGLCGARMYVAYKYSHRYTCQNLDTTVLGGSCASLNGPSLDEAVARAFLEALQPAQLDTLDAVLKQQAEERTELDKHWQEQLRRTEYEAKLAQLQYDAVDPENRLVAAELEHRWEEKLQALRQAQEQYARFQHRPPSLLSRQNSVNSFGICQKLCRRSGKAGR